MLPPSENSMPLSGPMFFCSRTHLGATRVAVNLGSLAHAVMRRLMNVKLTPVKMEPTAT